MTGRVRPLFLLLLVSAVAACGQRSGTTPAPGVTGPAGSGATYTPAPMVSPTTTATPSPTAMPLPELAIKHMRERTYPGSEITIEQNLPSASNYDRYVVSYRSDGFKIYALLTVPQGDRPATGWPVVLFNHGYIPPAQYSTTGRYVAYVDTFARNGYIVLKSDYRGHGNSEGRPSGGYGSPAYTVDVLNALSSIKRYPAADPNRIGMWGHSMGGAITLRAMVVSPDIKAGVIWAGVVASYPDLFSRWHRQPVSTGAGAPPTSEARHHGWRDDFTARFGSPAENPAFWAAISPNSFLSDLSGPLQLHHGTADKEVPIEFSEELEVEVQAAGGEAELYTYEGDDHNLSKSLSLALGRSVAFFDEHLKNAD